MRVTVPTTLIIDSSNAAGSAYAEWSATHGTYNAGEYVKVTDATGYEDEYMCAVTHTSSADHAPADDPVSWSHLGASNKYKCVDDYIYTQTEGPTSGALTVTMVPAADDYLDKLALFGLDGEEVTVTVQAAGVTLLTEPISLDAASIYDWYDYFYAPASYRTKILLDIPGQYTDLSLSISITPRDGRTAKLGAILAGLSFDTGLTQWGVSLEFESYSDIRTNQFGETDITRRTRVKVLDFDTRINTSEYDAIVNRFESLGDVPVLWDANNYDTPAPTSFESFLVYGIYVNFSAVLPGAVKSICNLKIKGFV